VHRCKEEREHAHTCPAAPLARLALVRIGADSGIVQQLRARPATPVEVPLPVPGHRSRIAPRIAAIDAPRRIPSSTAPCPDGGEGHP